MCSEKPIYAPPRLSAISPPLPLKRFQCASDDGPLSPFQGRSSSTSSFNAFLLQAINGVSLYNNSHLFADRYISGPAVRMSRTSTTFIIVPSPEHLPPGDGEGGKGVGVGERRCEFRSPEVQAGGSSEKTWSSTRGRCPTLRRWSAD